MSNFTNIKKEIIIIMDIIYNKSGLKYLENINIFKKYLIESNDLFSIKYLLILIFIFLILSILYKLYKKLCSNKNILTGGNMDCNIDYINSAAPIEDYIIFYYAGKIYSINKKKDLKKEQYKLFDLIQELVINGYEFEYKDNTTNEKRYQMNMLDNNNKVKHYKDLTKFFNYYELYQKDGTNLAGINKWKNLYEAKASIIELLENKIKNVDVVCLNNFNI